MFNWLVLFCFRVKASHCSPGWPGTGSVAQDGLKFMAAFLKASASQMLESKAWTTTWLLFYFETVLLGSLDWPGSHYGRPKMTLNS